MIILLSCNVPFGPVWIAPTFLDRTFWQSNMPRGRAKERVMFTLLFRRKDVTGAETVFDPHPHNVNVASALAKESLATRLKNSVRVRVAQATSHSSPSCLPPYTPRAAMPAMPVEQGSLDYVRHHPAMATFISSNILEVSGE